MHTAQSHTALVHQLVVFLRLNTHIVNASDIIYDCDLAANKSVSLK